MRQKRTHSAPVRVLTHKRPTSTPLTVADYPRSSTARTSCRSRVSRRLGSAMSGSGLGSAVEAFTDISLDSPGLFIWRLEGRRLQLVDCNDHGFFLEGTAYIVLKITVDKTSSLHYWNGRLATENDISLIQELASELDSSICRASVFSREVQAHESLCFMRLFPDGVVYMEGGPHTSLSRTTHYVRRLYVVTGRKHVRAACQKPMVSALDSSVSLILDGFPRVYVWIGDKCGYVTRVRAIQVARRIRNWQRKGKAHVVVIDEKDEELNKSFLKKLDEEPERSVVTHVNGHTDDDDQTEETVVLHRVSGDRVLYDMPFAARKPLQYKYLVSSSSYLLDTGPGRPLYLWVGCRASSPDVANAVLRGQTFSEYKKYPSHLPVCRILEGHEPLQFRQAFSDWRERPSKPQGQTKKYSAGNMGRALFSRSGRRAVPKISDTWSENAIDEDNFTFEVYVLKGESLDFVERWDYGTFSICHCYIIVCKQWCADKVSNQTVYYWMGSKSELTARKRILEIAMDSYQRNSAIVRVLDGKEPSHLLNVLGNAMGVFDKELQGSPSSVQIFSVREFTKENIRVTQVPPVASSLNSSAAFAVISIDECYLWYGRESGGPEREYAKYILGCINPSKMYDYDIVTEMKEPETFWELLGGKLSYDTDYNTMRLERRGARLFHSSGGVSGLSLDEIVDYDQEDLCEQDILLLDTFDQIFVWYGSNIASEERGQFIERAQGYLDQDHAGRQSDDVHLWYVCQGHEPQVFTKYFKTWESNAFGGLEAYNLARKRVRQENARIDVSSDILDKSHVVKNKYPYKALVRGELPSDVDPAQKQHHLTDKQFMEVLKISRFQFYQLPEWKQKQILKMAHLTSCKRTSTSSSLSLPLS